MSLRSLNEVRNKDCTDCGLCKTADFVCLTGFGRVPAKVMIVGEAPGQREDDSGVPFVGRSGKLLEAILEKNGLSRDEIYITNIVHCRPPDNRTPTMDEIRTCRKYFVDEVNIIRPDIIIALGSTALKGIFDTNLMSIGRERGKLLKWGRMKVIPTYHPAYALRNPEAAKWIFGDIKTGLIEARRTSEEQFNPKELDYNLVPPSMNNPYVQYLLKAPIVSLDIETTGLDMFNSELEIRTVAMSTKPEEGFCFKWEPKAIPILNAILANKELVINHTIKFDIKWLAVRGVTFKAPIWDVHVALHLLDENYQENDLKHLVRVSFPQFGAFLDKSQEEALGMQKKGIEVPLEKWVTYNCGDTDGAFRLYLKFLPLLEAEGLSRLMKQEMKVLRVLCHMELFGIKIDKARYYQVKKAYEELVAQKQLEVKRVLGDINLNSAQQLRDKLYKELRFSVVKVTAGKVPSVDEESLIQLKSQCKTKIQKEAIDKLLEYRGCEKIYSTYIDGLVKKGHLKSDGKLHCNFKMFTVTGRLSCTDPNLQNIKRNEDEDMNQQTGKMNVKLMFVSSFKDGVLIQGDYSQAELRLLAHVANDQALIEAFRQGRDIHTEVATKVFKVKYENVTEAQRKYTKQVNFGIVYVIGALGLSVKIGCSEQKAKRLIEDWFREFPDVAKWMSKMKLKVLSDGYVTNIFGRKRRFFLANEYDGKAREAQRQGVNAPIQGGAGDLTKYVMMKTHYALRNAGLQSRVIVNVHDAVMIDCPREEVEDAARILHDIAVNPPIEFRVPLKMDIKVGPSWAELKKYELTKEK